ncbi:MAG: DUF4348 domain-containing protein [Bacteroidetes bacterium]|nr:MAG: DUF4348 domain-containing protein [Bacteroidota bacterium]
MTIRIARFSGAVVLIAFLLAACRQQQADTDQPMPQQLPPDFVAFYERFHQDSAFQMAHIAFPLEGLPPEVDSATLAAGTFRWTPENWTLHRPFDPDSGFERTFVVYNDRMILEKLVHRNGQLGMARRWAKVGDEWQLIYFAGLNRVQGR